MSVLEEKLQTHPNTKLEQKLKFIEEERNELKNDFYLKINNFIEEINSLKQRLSRITLLFS